MATHSNGISALQLQGQLGIGSYKTAWLLARKLRRAMVDPERLPLAGLVEIDETSLPQRTKDDPPPAVAMAARGKGKMPVVGRWRSRAASPGGSASPPSPTTRPGACTPSSPRAVAPDATIKTDAWQGYPGAPVAGHDPRTVGAMAAHPVLPWTHRVFSNLKRWALGTYHGLRRQHLQAYLDEFVFRFNRRRTATPPSTASLGLATLLPHASYQMLIERS